MSIRIQSAQRLVTIRTQPSSEEEQFRVVVKYVLSAWKAVVELLEAGADVGGDEDIDRVRALAENVVGPADQHISPVADDEDVGGVLQEDT
jgi:hypothetical protein